MPATVSAKRCVVMPVVGPTLPMMRSLWSARLMLPWTVPPVSPASVPTLLSPSLSRKLPPLPSRSSAPTVSAAVCVTLPASVRISVLARIPLVPSTLPIDRSMASVSATLPALPASTATRLLPRVSV